MRRGESYIDTDVHPVIGDIHQLFPYMTRAWTIRFERERVNFARDRPEGYPHPDGSASRSDAVPPSGGRPGSDPAFVRSQYLDADGPERVILIPLNVASSAGGWMDPDKVAVTFRAANDYYLEQWLPTDERFSYALLAANPDPVQAAAEIRRVGAHPQISSVYFPPGDRLMGERQFYPIYEAAVELGLPIVVHTTGSPRVPFSGGPPTYYVESYVNGEQVGQSNLSSLIFQAVFERYPGLRVAFIEYGFAWVPTFCWRMDRAWTQLRSSTPWVKRPPSEYVQDFVRFGTQPVDCPSDPRDLDTLLDLMHAEDLLMFSSDYPHWDNDMPTRVFSKMEPERRRKIYYDNAAAFFRLQPSAVPSGDST